MNDKATGRDDVVLRRVATRDTKRRGIQSMEITDLGSQADREEYAQRRSEINAAAELCGRGVPEHVGISCAVIENFAALV